MTGAKVSSVVIYEADLQPSPVTLQCRRIRLASPSSSSSLARNRKWKEAALLLKAPRTPLTFRSTANSKTRGFHTDSPGDKSTIIGVLRLQE
jgi:hypothetical protein